MGKEIEKIAIERNHEIILKIDTADDWEKYSLDFVKPDVAIEFSTPESVIDNIVKSFSADVPIVVGTTGWNQELNSILDLCKEKGQTIFYASNFSIGVNIFFEINKKLAKLMNNHSEYEVFIEEVHHTQKLDAPSGTAITLANDVIKYLHRKEKWKNEMSEDDQAIGIKSVRENNIPGTHIITYESDVDSIEIKHTAKSRKGFAYGAVLAAEFIFDKKGVFEMKDLF